MHKRLLPFLTALAVAVVGLPIAHAPAQEAPPAGTVRAGYGEADATWHVGAGAGQYTDKNPDNVVNSVSGGDVDPHGHSIAQTDSYGVHSRLSYRTIVVEDGEGEQVAFVKADSYLAMDYLARRAGQILTLAGSAISYEEIFHMASHNHSSPYYMTPSPGPWIFQDAFDIRAFEYHARALAQSILNAEDAMVDARMGATTVQHNLFKGMIQRKGISDDGTPRGYPDDFGDLGLSVIRFDDMTDPANPKPLATLINWGMHPEGLDGHDLITGDFVASLERFVERDTGAPLVFGQGDVGSAEAGPGRPELVAELGIPARWSHAGHAQGERGGFLLSRDVVEGWKQIATGDPLVPFSSDFDVEAGNAFVAGPYSHPYPATSACRSETTLEGQPGAGTAADCTRGPHANETDDTARDGVNTVWEPIKEETGHGQPNPVPDDPDVEADTSALWESLKDAGVPIPDNYDVPSYFALEENTRLHLQAFKMGEVIIASCACEAQVDLILNFESRANEVQGDIWDGFDWTAPNRLPQSGEVLPARMDCTQADPPEGDWTCTRNASDPRPRAVLPSFTATDYEYRRMKAQIHNDAAGWDDPQNAVSALSEPYDTTAIFGNFTQTELSPEEGYKLAIGVGHAGDYNGYTISYREFQSWDDYRKSLTSYGPHTADYMTTRMTQLAASLNGFPQPELEQDIARGLPDEARQVAMSTALGATSMAAWEAWRAALPVDKDAPEAPVGEALTQPNDIKRFDAATFSWRGGSNAVDNPIVTVERRVDDEWVPFADQSGEIQTKVEFPNGMNAFADTYSGNQEWIWTANFEAFNALPAGIGSTPEGEYRFVVDGDFRSQPAFIGDYDIVSEPFTVSAWDGINVHGLTVEDEGSVSFAVDSIEYPKTYDSEFRYVAVDSKGDELGKPFCTTCSFRPWAFGSTVDSATVTVERADGTTEQVPASRGADGRWHADTQLYQGDRAYVAEGGVVDEYGERNASRTNVGEGTTPRPTEEPSTTPSDTGPTSPSPTPPVKKITTLSFEGSDGEGQFSDTASIVATLTDQDGSPVSNADVSFEMVGADKSWTATTDDDGRATETIALDMRPGSYLIRAFYAGSSTHNETGGGMQFVVAKEDTNTSLSLAGKGSKRSLTAELTDADSPQTGVADALIEFFADGEKIGEARTGNNGRASIDVPARFQGGHHDFEARFGGNDNYEGSRGQTSS
jgi:hypothetical protein